MKMQIETQPERMTLAELQKQVEYQCLLPAQKKFIDVLLLTGAESGTFDFLAAAAVAYPNCMTNHASLAVRSCQLQSHPRVKRVLDMAFGRKPEKTDPVMTLLRPALKKAIKHDIATLGTLSDATAKSLQVYEQQTGKTVKVSKANV
jgi:hypothetical protein